MYTTPIFFKFKMAHLEKYVHTMMVGNLSAGVGSQIRSDSLHSDFFSSLTYLDAPKCLKVLFPELWVKGLVDPSSLCTDVF